MAKKSSFISKILIMFSIMLFAFCGVAFTNLNSIETVYADGSSGSAFNSDELSAFGNTSLKVYFGSGTLKTFSDTDKRWSVGTEQIYYNFCFLGAGVKYQLGSHQTYGNDVMVFFDGDGEYDTSGKYDTYGKKCHIYNNKEAGTFGTTSYIVGFKHGNPIYLDAAIIYVCGNHHANSENNMICDSCGRHVAVYLIGDADIKYADGTVINPGDYISAGTDMSWHTFDNLSYVDKEEWYENEYRTTDKKLLYAGISGDYAYFCSDHHTTGSNCTKCGNNFGYTVSFDKNNENATGTMTNLTNRFGENTIGDCGFKAPTGKVFKGWSTSKDESDLIKTTSYNVTQDTTLFAIWEDLYTISYNSNGGTECETLEGQTNLPDKLPNPTKKWFVFDGWYYNYNSETKTFTNVATAGDSISSNVTLYAKWTFDTEQITWKQCTSKVDTITPTENISFDDAVAIAENKLSSITGEELIIRAISPVMSITGEVYYDGIWYSVKDSVWTEEGATYLSIADIKSLIGEGATVYIIGTFTEISVYTITYNSNGGTEYEALEEQTNLPDELPTPTKDGFVFDNWYYNYDSETKEFSIIAIAGSPIASNVTLYAKWLKTLTDCTDHYINKEYDGEDYCSKEKLGSLIVFKDGENEVEPIIREYSFDGNGYAEEDDIPWDEYTAKNVGEYKVYYRYTYNGYEKQAGYIELNIYAKVISKPTGDSTIFVYNGKEQEYTIAESDLYTVSGNTKTNAGEYAVTISLNDKTNYAWAEEKSSSIDDLNYTFVIEQIILTDITSKEPIDVDYNGYNYGNLGAVEGNVLNFDGFLTGDNLSETATLKEFKFNAKDDYSSSLQFPEVKNVGTYTVYYRYSFVNYSIVEGSFVFKINPLAVAEPTVVGTYAYTGEEQTVELNGFDDSYMSTTSNLTQTLPGTYTISITLDGNHTWAEGGDGEVVWKITCPVIVYDKNQQQAYYVNSVEEAVNTILNLDEDYRDYSSIYVMQDVQGDIFLSIGEEYSLTVYIYFDDVTIKGTFTINAPDCDVHFVFKEGSTHAEITDKVYVQAGMFDVTSIMSNEDLTVTNGYFLNDHAYISGYKDDMTVRTNDSCTLYVINNEDMKDAIAISNSVLQQINSTVELKEYTADTKDRIVPIKALEMNKYIDVYYSLAIASTLWKDAFKGSNDNYVPTVVGCALVTFLDGYGAIAQDVEGEFASFATPIGYDQTSLKENLNEYLSGCKVYYLVDKENRYKACETCGGEGWHLDEEENEVTCETCKRYGAVVTLGYTINFEAKGGTFEGYTSLTEQMNLPSKLPTPTKANYSFDGWYTNEGLTIKAVPNAEINDDTTLYAKWLPKTAVSINEEAQSYTYNTNVQAFDIAGQDKDLQNFFVYYASHSDSEHASEDWSTTAPTNVGSYDIKITRAEDNTYASYSKEIKNGLVIAKATTVITIADNITSIVKTYGETVTIPTATANFGTVSCDKVSSDLVNAGSYTITYTVVGTENYNGATETVSVTINKKEIVIDWENTEYVYNGDVQSVTATYKDVNGDTVYLTVSINKQFQNAGDYTATASFASATTNYTLPSDATKNYTINKKEVNEPTVTGNYVYNGQQQTVILSGVENFMTTSDSLTQINVGVYTITFTLDNNHKWANGSDGIITWEIKSAEIKTEIENESEKPQVIVETDKGISNNVNVTVEVTIETEVETKDLSVDYYNLENEDVKLAKNEKVGVVFDVKLIRTVDGVSSTIQPTDLEGVTSIKVKMLIPNSVNTSKVTRILHVHADGTIDEIEFDASKVDEDGYYTIEVSKLSEFAFIYENDSNSVGVIVLVTTTSIVFVIILVGLLYLFLIKRKATFIVDGKEVAVLKFRPCAKIIQTAELKDYAWFKDAEFKQPFTKEKMGIKGFSVYGKKKVTRKSKKDI